MSNSVSGENFVIGSLQHPVRISFSQGLFKARAAAPGAPEKFGCTLIMPKTSPWVPVIVQAVKKVIVETWGEQAIGQLQAGMIKPPLLDGASPSARSKKTGELHPGFGPDVVFIRTTSGYAPKAILKKDGSVATNADEIYSGSYGKAMLNCFSWTNAQQGRGVSVGLTLWQMLAEGERLGRGEVDVASFVEIVQDAGPAPAVTQGGAGAAGLFGAAGAPAAGADVPFMGGATIAAPTAPAAPATPAAPAAGGLWG